MKSTLLRYPQDWIQRKKTGPPISIVTCYDYTMAKWISFTEIDAILVGDSLGMVIQGHSSTLPVNVEEIIYHTKIVKRGAPEKFLIADMPFGSYQSSFKEALQNSFQIIKKTNCQALKFEGSSKLTLKIIRQLVKSGVPVMGHIGLTPQSFMNFSGFRIQGKIEEQKKSLKESAKQLEDAGCFSIVLELITPEVAQQITEQLQIPTIGIGSGPKTDGQVLVLYDLLGMDPNFTPKHAKKYQNFAHLGISALQQYDKEVKQKKFPIIEK